MNKSNINRSHTQKLPRPDYLKWMISEPIEVKGVPTKCYELKWQLDEGLFDAWALHVRRHYIRDDELIEDCYFFGYSMEDYLKKHCIPRKSKGHQLGSATRAGDFAEILISDALEFIEGYKAPRYKQTKRINKDNSDQGSDVIAYKVTDHTLASPDDTLFVVEVKAKLTNPILAETIKNAVKDSKKDIDENCFRLGMSLRSIAKRSNDEGDLQTAKIATRFMKKVENPFTLERGSAAIVSLEDIEDEMKGLKAEQLGLTADEKLIVVHGEKLMDLVHYIYDRCVR